MKRIYLTLPSYWIVAQGILAQEIFGQGVLAQGHYVHMGRRFRHGSQGMDATEFTMFVAILVAVGILAIWLSRFLNRKQQPGYTSTRALFGDLCRAHQLKWSSRRLLNRLAAAHEVAPCQLFLEPKRFEPEHLTDGLERYKRDFASLKESLFGDPQPEEESDA